MKELRDDEEMNKMRRGEKKGTPKHDGSGRGRRANRGRGGCEDEEDRGKGRR